MMRLWFLAALIGSLYLGACESTSGGMQTGLDYGQEIDSVDAHLSNDTEAVEDVGPDPQFALWFGDGPDGEYAGPSLMVAYGPACFGKTVEVAFQLADVDSAGGRIWDNQAEVRALKAGQNEVAVLGARHPTTAANFGIVAFSVGGAVGAFDDVRVDRVSARCGGQENLLGLGPAGWAIWVGDGPDGEYKAPSLLAAYSETAFGSRVKVTFDLEDVDGTDGRLWDNKAEGPLVVGGSNSIIVEAARNPSTAMPIGFVAVSSGGAPSKWDDVRLVDLRVESVAPND